MRSELRPDEVCGALHQLFLPGPIPPLLQGDAPGSSAVLEEHLDLTAREVSVTVDLKSGDHRANIWTNDLTHAYVHENSAYSS